MKLRFQFLFCMIMTHLIVRTLNIKANIHIQLNSKQAYVISLNSKYRPPSNIIVEGVTQH